MNLKDMAQYLGKKGAYRINGISVEVKILNVKSAYGRIDYQIEPVSGTGQIWVNSGSVRI